MKINELFLHETIRIEYQIKKLNYKTQIWFHRHNYECNFIIWCFERLSQVLEVRAGIGFIQGKVVYSPMGTWG
jgi:hypothetical protein